MSALSPLLFISSFYKHFAVAWVSRVVRDPRDWLLLVASTIIVSPLTGLWARWKSLEATLNKPKITGITL